jgi:MbtH protein
MFELISLAIVSRIEGTMFADDDDSRRFKVVVNHEEQYSIWPEARDVPPGWHEEGTVGTKVECLQHIESVWTDMRPLSLQRAMEAGRKPSA